MKDTFEFTLKENPSEELYEMLSDVNVETTPSFTIQDTHGNIAEYVKVIRCKDCRWFINKECAIYCLSSAHEETFCSYAEPKDSTAEVRRQLKETEQRKEMERKK